MPRKFGNQMYLTVREILEILNISKASFYKNVFDKLTSIKIGRRRLFSVDAFIDYLDNLEKSARDSNGKLIRLL